jgi:N-acetylmuramoyl-L-alanine amidase
VSAGPGVPAGPQPVRALQRWLLHTAALLTALGLTTSSTVEVRQPQPAASSDAVNQDQLLLPMPTAAALPPLRPALEAPLRRLPAVDATPIPCTPPNDEPLPAEDDPNAREFWSKFEAPLPPAPVWNPPGPKRVGIQAGHWLRQEVPWELHHLDFGGSGGGRQEWEVTLDLAKRVQRQLAVAGVQADVLPVAVPEHYLAHAFVAIHADASVHPAWRGFKIARPDFSAIAGVDDQLVADLEAEYAEATGFPRDADHISSSMRQYYAFNSRRYCHSVAPGVPQAIIETGYLTNAEDRAILFDDGDTAAHGITEGILRFLNGRYPLRVR